MNLTIRVKVFRCTNIHLCFATNIAQTIGFATVTCLYLMSMQQKPLEPKTGGEKPDALAPMSINVVVKCQFLMFSYIPLSKDPHTNVLPHSPFTNVAIWFATMIRKTTDATALGRVNELGNPRRYCAEIGGSNGESQPRPFGALRSRDAESLQ